MLFGLFSCTHNYSCAVLYPLHSSLTRTQHFTHCAAADFHKSPNKSSTNHRKKSPQITEQIFLKSPKKISSNHRTNLPQITEKFAFPINEKQAVTSIQSNSSYTLQVKYIAVVAKV